MAGNRSCHERKLGSCSLVDLLPAAGARSISGKRNARLPEVATRQIARHSQTLVTIAPSFVLSCSRCFSKCRGLSKGANLLNGLHPTTATRRFCQHRNSRARIGLQFDARGFATSFSLSSVLLQAITNPVDDSQTDLRPSVETGKFSFRLGFKVIAHDD